MRRMAMAANMAEMRPASAGCGSPKLDRIALGIVDARETPNAFHLIDLGNIDARLAKADDELVETIDAQVDHPLLVGGEIVSVRRERREDGVAGLLRPVTIIPAADAEMLAIPALERVRIIRPKEQSANSGHRHRILPLMKLAAVPARPGQACPRRDSRALPRPEARAPTG